MISGLSGEIYLVGGVDNSKLALNSIYMLKNLNSNWIILTQKLQRGRFFATAITISEDTVTCSKGCKLSRFSLYYFKPNLLKNLESTKVLIGGGSPKSGAPFDFFEVLDTENPNMVCQPFPNTPIPMPQPIFGFLNDNTTIITCTRSSPTTTRCFKLAANNWIEGNNVFSFSSH